MTDLWPEQLPGNATPWERAHELTDAERYPQDTDSVRQVKDALEAPENLLPVLAWERSVDVWWEGQSLSSKRYVTESSFALHKLKGTKEGLKQHIELTGASVIKIESPPLMAFPGRDMTEAERLAWLARFPQIRTFQYRNRGEQALAPYTTEQAYVAFSDQYGSQCAKFLVAINEFEFWFRHSYLWEPRDNSETALTVWTRTVTEIDKTVTVYDWIVLPGSIAERWFMDMQLAAYYLTGADPLSERTVSVYRDTQDYRDHNAFFTSRTISPHLRLIEIKPEHVAENGSASYADFFLDHDHAMPFLTLGSAELHIYDRLYLHDQDRGVTPNPPDLRVWLDHSWFQFPPMRSLSKVAIQLSLPPFTFTDFMRGYLIDADMEPLNRCLAAARSSSSARDATLIDTQTMDTVVASNSTFCGDLRCGSQIEI